MASFRSKTRKLKGGAVSPTVDSLQQTSWSYHRENSMKASHLIDALHPWLDAKLGVSLDSAGSDPVPVCERGLVTTRPEWVEALGPIVSRLSLDELFSTFGAYELARVLLPNGFGVWGPSWYFVGDDDCFCPVQDARPVRLEADELAEKIDRRIFWHCFPDQALVGFGIYDENKLIAVASVRAEGNGPWEIGMDVSLEAKRRGLGRAVVSAAGSWILAHNRLILATTAPWNVPSARTLCSVGLQFVMSDMSAMPGPFRVPPQPLGSPYPGVEMHNYYPDWAINKDIK